MKLTVPPHSDRRPRSAVAAALAAALLCALPGAGAGAPPPEGTCPTLSGSPGGEAQDAVATPLREGMVLDADALLQLRELLPEEVWRHRDAFFHEGMRMEIGPCHRRYPVPDFYERATARFADGVELDDEGNLRGYVAGLPFPPERMQPDGPRNGLRWAWNLEQRWRGAGPVGSFRIVDLPRGSDGFTYRGDFFFVQTRHRADLAASGYAVEESDGTLWVAGGEFEEPHAARHLAWRQMRPAESLSDYEEPDDIFVYVPTMRKMRRAATTWVDGIYTPGYRVSGDDAGGGMMAGSGSVGGTSTYGIPVADVQMGSMDSIAPTAGRSIAATEHVRSGFAGLSLRPNAYVWRVRREREVLAPLNGTRAGYPLNPDRNYGTSGLSVGSDRWEVRQAVVLEGRRRDRGAGYDGLIVYVDHQTRQPLYVITKRGRGRLVDVGILVHRFSGDHASYAQWPSGGKALVFDPVAAVFYSQSGDGWRRESYDVQSVPAGEQQRRRFFSSDHLLRGH